MAPAASAASNRSDDAAAAPTAPGQDVSAPAHPGQAAADGQPSGAAAEPRLAVEEVVTGLPLGQPERLTSLAGRQVRLTNVRVQEVIDDSVFWIGPSPTRRILVYLEGTGADAGAEVQVGQIANLYGGLRRLPSPEEMRERWGLPTEAAEPLQNQPIYIHITDIRDFRVVGSR